VAPIHGHGSALRPGHCHRRDRRPARIRLRPIILAIVDPAKITQRERGGPQSHIDRETLGCSLGVWWALKSNAELFAAIRRDARAEGRHVGDLRTFVGSLDGR
jgi:hypothetical protein